MTNRGVVVVGGLAALATILYLAAKANAAPAPAPQPQPQPPPNPTPAKFTVIVVPGSNPSYGVRPGDDVQLNFGDPFQPNRPAAQPFSGTNPTGYIAVASPGDAVQMLAPDHFRFLKPGIIHINYDNSLIVSMPPTPPGRSDVVVTASLIGPVGSLGRRP